MIETDNRYEILQLVQKLSRILDEKSEQNLKEWQLTAPQRRVLQFLHPHNKLSVPEIAAAYHVSRQHIQVTVNTLKRKGFLIATDNEKHQRSPKIMLTAKGRTIFSQMIMQEQKRAKMLFKNVTEEKIEETEQVLNSLLRDLEKK